MRSRRLSKNSTRS